MEVCGAWRWRKSCGGKVVDGSRSLEFVVMHNKHGEQIPHVLSHVSHRVGRI